MPKASGISLGDFIANIPAAHRSGDGCKGLAPAAAYLIAQQSSDDCADADANRAILCNRGRLLVGGCWLLVRSCLGIRLAGLRLCVLDLMVMHDSFVLYAFGADCRSSRDWLQRCRCDGESLCGHRRSWRCGGREP